MAKVFLGFAAVFLVGLGAVGTARSEEPPRPAAVAAVDESEPVAVPEPSEKAMTFYRTGMGFWAFNRLWAIALPAVILFSGFSARIRNLAAWIGRSRSGTVAVYVVLYLFLTALIELPFDYYQGFVRLHAYGLSNQTLAKWAQDHALDLAVNTGVAVLIALGAYAFLRFDPRRWWLYMALASIPFLFLGVFVKPLWIDPLFNDFGPMHDKALERSILDLADRAGIASGRVFEVDKSVDTKAVNAYVTGFLGSKRIVLWDTLLKRLGEREVLFVMAHEMGHYVLGHVVRSIFLSFAVTLVGLYFVHRLAHRLIERHRGRFGFDDLRDVASVPLILVLLQVAVLGLSPAAMAYSRYQEHEADRFAIDLTGMNHSGGTAFVKLQQENLGNPRPGWVYKIFRASHPSIGDRIDFCNNHRRTTDGPATPDAGRPGPLAEPPHD
ncbi:M48 family metallopeptidase [Paludisphaera mucosa]|uniref:M48 family metallopeptidase n=1 Tax=Paludisphaera mucosa TaxID=3030827 RepID=A0ABT6FIC1_9BACT|nr:M48 family metallopeptidase [Paludisphaera mucosa]MDG3007328.1 M48 family metallopeptidase [Paludisphaera mucosa]